METYLRAFVNIKQDNWARLLPMVKFTHNNMKNANTDYTLFELNCGFYLQASYEKNVDPHSQSKSADELAIELRELMAVSREKLQHV